MPRYKMEKLSPSTGSRSVLFYTYIDGVIWYYIAVETDTVINLYFDYLSFTDVYVPRLVQQFSY